MIDKNISILGSGTMGHSIALTAALAGFSIKVWGNDQHDIERGSKELHRKLGILVAEEVIDESKSKEITERIQFTLSIGKCIQDASFIIEAVPEILDLKQRLYEQLDQRCSMDVILASNTSGLSPTAIASRMKHPERMIVTHFWNPAHLIPLVEVVRGEKTADKTVKKPYHYYLK
ncbi:3-hydroxyacyl-CoA dehydrogenase family protein [Heyndrickxia ginsengihumi]|uniref:3-hydroxyacyl-CoA dehydrogenase family protein n=1 Tax=Heyndrickxia ginsengihumi TaxID=363870 RepID=UPI000ADA970D